MAFSGQYERVHTIFKDIPSAKRINYTDKNILNQVIWGGIEKLKEAKKFLSEDLILNEKNFLNATLLLFINECRKNNHFPKELFQSLQFWSEELIQLTCLDEALTFLNEAEQLGAAKFPDILIDIKNKKARIYILKGMLTDAYEILLHMVRHPYLIPDRKKIPQVLFNLSQVTLVTGNINLYKKLLFLGLRHFYTDMDERRKFVDQLRKTFRHSYRLLLNPGLNISDKILYTLHWFYYKVPDFRKIKMRFINKFFALFVLSYVYGLNYIRRDEPVSLKEPLGDLKYPVLVNNKNSEGLKKHRKKILITRAMGGIGDLLMMTPGFHALKMKHPSYEIHLAVPKRYYPLFEGNEDVVLRDIEEDELNHLQYGKWFNFTDCPAARKESKSVPKVKESRIDIFAKALGIKGIRLWKSDRKPRYFIHEEEQHFKNNFWLQNNLTGKKVIGVQLHSDETYRNYPHMEMVVKELAKEYSVLVFDGESIKGCNFENVIKLDNCSIRNAFALASGCDAIIAPDSSFVHFAASQDIPCIALFGPIDGKIRTKYYKYCRFIDARSQMECLPCWRNENIPCKLTNMRSSVCMSKINLNTILDELKNIIAQRGADENFK
jgi:ADP-heptose:LPS heptosyltransferase